MDQREPSRQDSREDADYDESTVSMHRLGESYQTLLGEQHWEVDVPGVSAELAETERALPPEAAEEAAPAAPPLDRIIEALLFVGGLPLTAARACEVIRGMTPAQFRQTIDSLNRRYRTQNRPYLIQPAASGERHDPSGRGRRESKQGGAAASARATEPGYVLELRPSYQPILNRLFGSVREARLSPQAVDVLSLVAYRQPVTKQEIDGIRGADSGALLRQLLRRGLIAITRRGESDQREVCYGTTPRFLELFRLRSLDELPQTQDLQKL